MLTFLLSVLALGCGAEESRTAVETGDGSAVAEPMDAGVCVPQACACGAQTGIQRCDGAGRLGLCECPPAPLQDAAIRTVGSCPSGSYAGNFEGTAGFLIAVGEVAGFDFFEEAPPLQINISPPTGAELVAIGAGKMRGNANGAFPFEATIMGMLDCDAKRFTATLVGSVQLVLDGIRNDFTGTMEATYDSEAQAFTAGTWTVTGSEADGGLDLGLTGSGSWSAQHVEDASSDAGP